MLVHGQPTLGKRRTFFSMCLDTRSATCSRRSRMVSRRCFIPALARICFSCRKPHLPLSAAMQPRLHSPLCSMADTATNQQADIVLWAAEGAPRTIYAAFSIGRTGMLCK